MHVDQCAACELGTELARRVFQTLLVDCHFLATHRCKWHPKMLEFACSIYTASPSAYAEAIAGGMFALPSFDHIKKLSRTGSTVHKDEQHPETHR